MAEPVAQTVCVIVVLVVVRMIVGVVCGVLVIVGDRHGRSVALAQTFDNFAEALAHPAQP